jgi:phage terminase small subunit
MSDTTTPQPTTPLTSQARYDAALAAIQAKRRKFVIEYLRDLNGTQAAIRAGYTATSAASTSSEILRNPKVAAAVSAGMALQAMPADEVLARLSQIARGSMADFVRVDEEEVQVSWSVLELPTDRDGNPDLSGTIYDLAKQQIVKPTQRILHTATVTRSVARLDLMEAGRQGKLGNIKKYTVSDDGKITIELYPATEALAKLGEHQGLWGKGSDILKSIDLTKLRPDQLERLSAGDDPLAVLLGQ